MNNVRSKKSWHWTFFKLFKSVEGTNRIVKGWLIMRVTTTRSKNSTYPTRHSPYQGSKLYRLRGNTGLSRSHTQLCWRGWRIIPCQGYEPPFGPVEFICGLLDAQSMTSTSWFSRKFLVSQVVWMKPYLGLGQICFGRCLLPSVGDFVAAHVCTLAGSWCCPEHHLLTVATIVTSSPYDGRWTDITILPAHRH